MVKVPRPGKCSECGGAKVAGVVVDFKWGGVLQSRWMLGVPDSGRVSAGKEFFKRELRRVVSYRCTECGLLTSYAQDIEQAGTPASWDHPPPFE